MHAVALDHRLRLGRTASFSSASYGHSPRQVRERQERVTFRFGDAIEVHYVAALPKAGDFVSHRNELWLTVRLERDSLGAVVVCERDVQGPTEGGRQDSANGRPCRQTQPPLSL
jgi:hypothetical protein